MDKYDAQQTLKHLYRLENRSTRLGTEEDYIKFHMSIILEGSDGVWDGHEAEVYLENLRHSA